jgi:hypothetical protein
MPEMWAAMPGEPCTAKVVETAEMSAVEVAAEMSAEVTAEMSATVAPEMDTTVTTTAMSPTVAAASPRESAARQHGCQQDNSHSDHRPRHWHPRRAVSF